MDELISLLAPAFGIAAGVFWIWMLVDCARNEPNPMSWLWIIFIFNAAGALIYFLARKAPRMDLQVPNYFNRWLRGQELMDAESAARLIGKAQQYINLGNVLWDMRLLDRAAAAFQTALEKEPKNIYALWGAAGVATDQKDYAKARESLQLVVKLEPDFKFGEATLAYSRTLLALNDWDAARSFLEKIPTNALHPEAQLMLASVLERQGDLDAARTHCQSVVDKIRSSPAFYRKKHHHLVNKAERMMRSLA